MIVIHRFNWNNARWTDYGNINLCFFCLILPRTVEMLSPDNRSSASWFDLFVVPGDKHCTSKSSHWLYSPFIYKQSKTYWHRQKTHPKSLFVLVWESPATTEVEPGKMDSCNLKNWKVVELEPAVPSAPKPLRAVESFSSTENPAVFSFLNNPDRRAKLCLPVFNITS